MYEAEFGANSKSVCPRKNDSKRSFFHCRLNWGLHNMAANYAIDTQALDEIQGRCFSSDNADQAKQTCGLHGRKYSNYLLDSHHVARWLATLTLSVLMSSCAHIWTDKYGVQHVTGFVHLQIPTNPKRDSTEAIRMTSMGLTLVQSRWVNELVVGYNDSTLMQIGPDSCVQVSLLNERFPVLHSE